MAQAQQKPVAVVVGVGPGTGAALARRFAKGYRIALVARSADYLKTLAAEIRADDAEVLEAPADVGNFSEVAGAFAAIRAKLAQPKLLLSNAGTRVFAPFLPISPYH